MRFGTIITATGAAAAITAAGLVAVAPVATAAPKPAKSADFNGDGIRDLVAPVDDGKVGSINGAGFVVVVPGGKKGPKAAGRQVISRAGAGIPGDPKDGGAFGDSVASADFDRDGHADLVVDSGGGTEESVLVVYGGKKGLSSRVITLPTPGIKGGDLAVGDFNRDGAADLVVANSTDATDYHNEYIVFSGLRNKPVAGVKTIVPGTSEETAYVHPVAADFTGDGYTDLAVMVGNRIDGELSAARMELHLGSKKGLGSAKAVPVKRPDKASAASDINGDGRADLVVGEKGGPGAFNVLMGTAGGLGKPVKYTQDTAGVPDKGEGGDEFGAALAAGDANGDGKADIAVGAPGEDLGRTSNAGAVTLLYGSKKGLTTKGAQFVNQSTKGVGGDPEKDAAFGTAVALTDVTGDGRADLTAGVPNTDRLDGRLQWLPGARAGVTAKGSLIFTGKSLGIVGTNGRLGRDLMS